MPPHEIPSKGGTCVSSLWTTFPAGIEPLRFSCRLFGLSLGLLRLQLGVSQRPSRGRPSLGGVVGAPPTSSTLLYTTARSSAPRTAARLGRCARRRSSGRLRARVGARTHAASYPASWIALRSASSESRRPWMVTTFESRSTSTDSTPATSATSSLIEAAQCPQWIAGTV